MHILLNLDPRVSDKTSSGIRCFLRINCECLEWKLDSVV